MLHAARPQARGLVPLALLLRETLSPTDHATPPDGPSPYLELV